MKKQFVEQLLNEGIQTNQYIQYNGNLFDIVKYAGYTIQLHLKGSEDYVYVKYDNIMEITQCPCEATCKDTLYYTICTERRWKDIPQFAGRYQVSQDGLIRTKSKKLKKTIQDTRGLSVVVLDDTVYYTEQLAYEAFKTPYPDVFNQQKVYNLENEVRDLEAKLESVEKSVSHRGRKRYIIKEIDDGREFKSYTECAIWYGFEYDQIYNAFYNSKNTADENGTLVVKFKGHTFARTEIK